MFWNFYQGQFYKNMKVEHSRNWLMGDFILCLSIVFDECVDIVFKKIYSY